VNLAGLLTNSTERDPDHVAGKILKREVAPPGDN
jgi:hypothetical protein